ncbi:hypothetical protein Tco_1294400 [Tanacetum coccineum]
MAESSNPPQSPPPNQEPNQEPNPQQQDQLERPESPISFDLATQVGFNLEDIIFNDNNEVSLLYPLHINSDYFKVVSDFISKCCLREAYTRTPNQYKEEVGVNTFRNAIGANYLAHSTDYAKIPSFETVRVWFLTIGYSREIRAKETLKKSCLPPRWRVEIDFAMLIWEDFGRKLNKKTREKVIPCPWFLSLLLQHKMEGYGNEELTLNPTQVFSVHNWALKKNQPGGPPFINYVLAICNANAPVAFKAPKTSPKDEKKSKIEAAKASTIIHSEPVSGHDASAGFTAEVDLGKSDPNDSISKQQGMDKGTQNYSIDHIIAGTDPLVLVEKTKSASKGLETILTKPVAEKEASHAKKEVSYASDEFNTSPDLTSADEISKTIKLEHLSKLVQNVEADFMDLDSPEDDEPIIVQDESDEEVHAEKVQTEEPKETKDTTASHPPFPKTVKIQELITQLLVLQTLNSKLVREKEAAETEAAWFKAQPSYPNMEQLSQLLVNFIKPKLSKLLSSHDFNSSLPTELKDLPSKFNELTGEVKYLKNHVHDLEIELLGPNKLEIFTLTVQISSVDAKIKTLDALPSLLNKVTKSLNKFAKGVIKKDKGKEAMSSKDAEEEMTKSDYDDTINLTGSMVEKAQSRITICDVLTRKGSITLKVYKEDGTDEVIPNFKANGLHLDEWREVVKACTNKKGAGEQDPLDRLNDLARKKVKHADDIHDLFRYTKKCKSSVKYGDHPAGTVLNKPILGMILFNFFYRQDFVTIEDFEDFSNKMMYTVREIFFRLHQGPRLDDHARTSSSFLLDEVDKRNLNPLKQMRAIEQLRQ